MFDFQGVNRCIVYACLVGSHNYNLDNIDSDQDYKVFVLPTFEDLYFHTFYSYSRIGNDIDFTVHDIRKLAALLWKGNLNFIETLFSEAYCVSPKECAQRMEDILQCKEKLARINLPNVWDACQGMSRNKFTLLQKGTQGTLDLVRRYGYDTKQAQHCYRCLDFLQRYAENDFASFKAAVWYDHGPDRDMLLQIKQGLYTLAEFKSLVQAKWQTLKRLEKYYKNQELDSGLHEWLDEQIKEIIRANLLST